jgi:hypothetical protein
MQVSIQRGDKSDEENALLTTTVLLYFFFQFHHVLPNVSHHEHSLDIPDSVMVAD